MSVRVMEGPVVLTTDNLLNDSFGLPVQRDRVHGAGPTTPRTQSYGVRVPVLKDLDGRYIGKLKHTPCRFDIVERVDPEAKPEAYDADENVAIMKSPGREYVDDDGKHIRPPVYVNPGQPQREGSVLDRIGTYNWNKWVKTSKESDARDVLYRNTYCHGPEYLRYRSLTLPRISTDGSEERPWTVAGDEAQKSVIKKSEHGEYSKVVTIVPQQPRGSVVKFREYMKPCTYSSDDRPLEVKRVSSRQSENSHFTTVKSVFPLIRHDFRRSPKRQERPLKFENARYIKGNKGTLFTKHILPAYKNAFDRDYSSADTFKAYLESLQKTGTPGLHSKEMTGYRFFNEPQKTPDYHNQVLQSVSDVNHPDAKQDESIGDHDPMKIEIKSFMKDATVPKAPTIDNLSSVRGSLVQGRSDSQSHLPISSSVVGGKSAVKETKEEPVVTAADSSPAGRHVPVVLPTAKTGEEEDIRCPANTPTPDS